MSWFSEADRPPNFFVIGAPRSGTTSLNEYLSAHPDVYMSPVKEPDLFALRVVDEDAGLVPDTLPATLRPVQTELSDYKALFAAAGAQRRRGEASAVYLGHPNAASHIRRHLPEAKLIAVLRDPAERLHSHHVHALRVRLESGDEAGAAALPAELERALERAKAGQALGAAATEPEVWVRSGFYAQHLRRYLSLFPAAQLKVFLFEDLLRDPRQLMREVYEFLGVDSAFALPTTAAFNAGVVPKHRELFRFFTTKNPLMRVARRLSPPRLRAFAVEVRNELLGRNKPRDDAGLRQVLIEIYREDILALEEHLKRDLSAWRRAEKHVLQRAG